MGYLGTSWRHLGASWRYPGALFTWIGFCYRFFVDFLQIFRYVGHMKSASGTTKIMVLSLSHKVSSGCCFGAKLSPYGHPKCIKNTSWRHLGASWGRTKGLPGPSRVPLGRLGGLLPRLGTVLGTFPRRLARPGGPREAPRRPVTGKGDGSPPNPPGPGIPFICRLAWTCPLNGQVVTWTEPHGTHVYCVDGPLPTNK